MNLCLDYTTSDCWGEMRGSRDKIFLHKKVPAHRKQACQRQVIPCFLPDMVAFYIQVVFFHSEIMQPCDFPAFAVGTAQKQMYYPKKH